MSAIAADHERPERVQIAGSFGALEVAAAIGERVVQPFAVVPFGVHVRSPDGRSVLVAVLDAAVLQRGQLSERVAQPAQDRRHRRGDLPLQ